MPPTQSFYERCVREEAQRQRAQGTFEDWCVYFNLDPALFTEEVSDDDLSVDPG